jgi:hypothetical protein
MRKVLPRRHSNGSAIWLVNSAVDSLLALVLGLERPLHIEIQLSFGLDSLLLHVPNDALVHCL